MKSQEEKLKDALVNLNYKIYQRYLRTISDERLCQEYSDRISGDENISVGKMIDQLEDTYSIILFDDPLYIGFPVEDIFILEKGVVNNGK